MMIRYGTGATPVGPAFAAVTDRGVCALYLLDAADESSGVERLREEWPDARLVEDLAATDPVFHRLADFLNEGDPCVDLTIDVPRATEFQRRVWDALRAVPRGETRTYGELATAIGRPRAARAVGSACAANPVGVFIPCHRAVRAGGGLGGYYWGLDRKRALLALESAGVSPALARA